MNKVVTVCGRPEQGHSRKAAAGTGLLPARGSAAQAGTLALVSGGGQAWQCTHGPGSSGHRWHHPIAFGHRQ